MSTPNTGIMPPALEGLAQARLIVVLTVNSTEDVAPLGQALSKSGVKAVELALRTPASMRALRLFRKLQPDLLIGAGTVLTPSQADEARAAGADFALAPGLDAATVNHCSKMNFPFVPGVGTASEVQHAIALRCLLLKWFPAGPMGGVIGLRTLSAPFRHLGVRFLPLGGIDAESMGAWLKEPLVAAMGGSWIAPTDLIERKAWGEIENRATHAIRLLRASAT